MGKNGGKLGNMGENGEEFRGEFGFISPRNFPFPHFSPKITVVTNRLSPLIVIFYIRLSSKYNYVYYKKSTKDREIA